MLRRLTSRPDSPHLRGVEIDHRLCTSASILIDPTYTLQLAVREGAFSNA